jgi:hypothetical protein
MSYAMDSTERFATEALPLLRSLIEPLGFALQEPVRYYGPDSKGAGSLRIVAFTSSQAQLMVRTRDGATEILIGPLHAHVGWQDIDWLYPAQLDGSTFSGMPSAMKLRAIAVQLDMEGIAWC